MSRNNNNIRKAKRVSVKQCIAIVGVAASMMFSSSVLADKVAALTVTSDAFQHKGELPKIYSCDGDEVSPPLTISQIPEGAKSLVLIHDDPDAPSGTWLHWLLYNVPVEGSSMTIEQGAPTDAVWANGTMQGRNSWGEAKYGGACPPDGTHRYFFKVYALDTVLDLKKKRSLGKVKKAMKSHVLAKGKLMASYP